MGTANELARGNSGPSNSFVLVHAQVILRKGPFRPELSHCRSGCSRIWAQHAKLVKHCDHVSAGLYMLANMVTAIWLVQIHFVLLPAGCRGVVNVVNSSSTTRDGVSHAFGDLHLRACVGTRGHNVGPLGTSNNKCWSQRGHKTNLGGEQIVFVRSQLVPFGNPLSHCVRSVGKFPIHFATSSFARYGVSCRASRMKALVLSEMLLLVCPCVATPFSLNLY